MQTYMDTNRDSGVAAYETGFDFIKVRFKDGHTYTYTNISAGAHNISRMKVLAANGNGLNSFINANVRKKYARKE